MMLRSAKGQRSAVLSFSTHYSPWVVKEAASFFPSDCQQGASPSVPGSPGFVRDAFAGTWDLTGFGSWLPHTLVAPFSLGTVCVGVGPQPLGCPLLSSTVTVLGWAQPSAHIHPSALLLPLTFWCQGESPLHSMAKAVHQAGFLVCLYQSPSHSELGPPSAQFLDSFAVQPVICCPLSYVCRWIYIFLRTIYLKQSSVLFYLFAFFHSSERWQPWFKGGSGRNQVLYSTPFFRFYFLRHGPIISDPC